MLRKITFATGFAALAASPAIMAQTTADIDVVDTVQPACRIVQHTENLGTTGLVDFGIYSPTANDSVYTTTPDTTVSDYNGGQGSSTVFPGGAVVVECSPTTAYSVAIDSGDNFDATAGQRTMVNTVSGQDINYTLSCGNGNIPTEVTDALAAVTGPLVNLLPQAGVYNVTDCVSAWGDGTTAGGEFKGLGLGIPVPIPLGATAIADGFKAPGAYEDTVTVTLTFQ